METDTSAGDDVGNIMWMRGKWADQVRATYGTAPTALHQDASDRMEGMDEVVEEIKHVQAERAKRKCQNGLLRMPCVDMLVHVSCLSTRMCMHRWLH